MTKKDYIAIADVIKMARDGEVIVNINKLIHGLADYFEDDNPNFDRHKFFDYITK